MKCSQCPLEGDEFQFAYIDTRRMDKPLCISCFIKEVEERMKKVEETLHKKSCILCKFKGYSKDLVSLSVAPTKLICKPCGKALYLIITKEDVDATMYEV